MPTPAHRFDKSGHGNLVGEGMPSPYGMSSGVTVGRQGRQPMRTNPVRSRYPMCFARFVFAEMFRRDCGAAGPPADAHQPGQESLPDVFCPVRFCEAVPA